MVDEKFDLKAFRAKHELNQTELAELWDVDRTMISKWENGEHPAMVEYAARALDAELSGPVETPNFDAERAELKGKIAELEKALAKKLKTVAEPSKAKPSRRRLGRAKGAVVQGIPPSTGDV